MPKISQNYASLINFVTQCSLVEVHQFQMNMLPLSSGLKRKSCNKPKRAGNKNSSALWRNLLPPFSRLKKTPSKKPGRSRNLIASYRFSFTWFILQFQKQRWYVPPKQQFSSIGLHCIISQKSGIIIFTDVRTTNPK